MKTINVKRNSLDYVASIPTTIEEINKAWVCDITKHIRLAPDYALIMVVYNTSMYKLINDSKKKGDITASVVPVFVKSGYSDVDFINSIPSMSIVNITGSDLSLGLHVNVPGNDLSLSFVGSMFAADNNLYKQAITDKENIKLVEFKIVPTCNIKGFGSGAPSKTPVHIVIDSNN